MRGIVLAGGSGSRLYPITRAVSKQLLPIYDKPLIFFPLSILMLSGIREITVITTPDDVNAFKRLLGQGERWGLSIQFCVQDRPKGIADALRIAEPWAIGHEVALILGDNVFFGHGLPKYLKRAKAIVEDGSSGAAIFGYRVSDPQRYGVVDFDSSGRAVMIEEKPQEPRSRYAVTGLYFYDKTAYARAWRILPSARRELEITDVNASYLKEGKLHVEKLGRGIAWLDTGTHDSLLQASQFVQTVQQRQGIQIACLEEVAYRNGWIPREAVVEAAGSMAKTAYGEYLMQMLRDEEEARV